MSKEKVIRNYRDTMFRLLFKGKKELLSLYNATNGTNYTNEDDLEVNTLENAVYMNMKNDISFVFDCAENDRTFCIPKDGSMKLQFFHVEDLCRFIEIILEKKPTERIYNVGNPETADINEWVKLCYDVVGKELRTVNVDESHPQRSYFSFYDYEYVLDVSRQQALLPDVKPLTEGLKESYEWYCNHRDEVMKKPLLEYIDSHIL